jgi:hypothetical protein
MPTCASTPNQMPTKTIRAGGCVDGAALGQASAPSDAHVCLAASFGSRRNLCLSSYVIRVILYSRPREPKQSRLVPEAQSAVPSFCWARERIVTTSRSISADVQPRICNDTRGGTLLARRRHLVPHSHDCRLPSRLSPQGTLGRNSFSIAGLEQRSLRPLQ